jgi:hypothetical protein
MMRRLSILFLGLAVAGAASLGLAGAQQQFTVMVNGSAMGFPDQPPVERAGRLYVPMRAIFERLGATVVYNNGTINATRGGRTIQLQIGSSYATVGGQQVQLDSPPFEIGARTLVPLRFVSQALGDRVSWDQSRLTAYIMGNGGSYANGYGNGGPNGQVPPYQPGSSYQRPGPAWADAGHSLVHRPSPWGQTSRPYPLINASFRTPVLPNSVRVMLDGRNVTGIARITPRGFEFTPAFPLRAGEHVVRIFARTQDGMPVSDSWSFTVVA